MIKIKEKEVLKTIYDNTHLKSEDNKDVPYFCFVSDVVDYLELDLSEEEVAQIALDADAGYTIFKVFAEETIPGGLLICADGCEKEEIENMYKDFYACEPPSIDPWLEEPLKEAKKKKPKKVGDPNAKAMWGRTRNKVEPPKKGKSSYKRKSKHKKVVEEIDFITAYFNNVNSASSPSINEDMDDDFYIEDDINVEIASVNPKEEMLKGVYELKQKYTDEAAGLGAEISFFEDISPKRIYSFWYDDDIAVIEYNDYVIIIYSYGDVCFFDNTRDNNREIYGKKELFNAGYYTDDQVMEALDDDVLEVDCTNHISFALKKEGEDDFKYSYDMGYESMDDIYDALDIKWYIEAVIPDYTSRFIEKEQLDTQIIKESNGKPSKNDLKKAARRHKKTDKKGARGWFVNPDAGNVEKNIAFFNHATGGSSSGVGEASPGLGEDLDNEHTEEQFLLEGTKYDNQAIKILDDANLFSHETNEKIIQLLYKGDEENEPDIHAFVHSPNWLMKYLKGIARMLVEYAEGSSTKAQEFLGEAPSVFEPVLTWVKTNRTDKNAKELDDNFVNKFSFQDVKDFLDEIHSQEQEISDKKLADLDTSKKSGYTLIPINSYEEMREFGNNVTGDSSISVSSPWCYATGRGTYDYWISGDTNKMYVLAKDGYEKIKPEKTENNPKDEYGLSLIGIRINAKTGKLLNATLRWNHLNVPTNADNQFTNYGELSEIVGFNVKEAVEADLDAERERLERLLENLDQYYYDKMLKTGVCNWKTIEKEHRGIIQRIIVPDSVVEIGQYAFYGCKSLTSITIPNSVVEIGRYAFAGCNSLTSITLPNSVVEIGQYAFAGCNSLTSITLPNSVVEIGRYAFAGCNSLTSITLPNSVVEIGQYAFYGCKSLTSITIPNSVEKIEDFAFDNCESLTSITIPNSVREIGRGAFRGCESLKDVYIVGKTSSGEQERVKRLLRRAGVDFNKINLHFNVQEDLEIGLKEEYLDNDKKVYATSSVYDAVNRLKSSKKSLRILWDRKIGYYFICDALDYIHSRMVEMALEQGYYENLQEWQLVNYLDSENENVVYYVYTPKGLEEQTYGSNIGEDGYDEEYLYDFGTLTVREYDKSKSSPLVKALGKYKEHYEQDGWSSNDPYKPHVVLVESLEDEYTLLQETFENYYKIIDTPPKQSSYLLQDGKFLDLNEATHGVFDIECDEACVHFDFLDSAIKLNTATSSEDFISYPYVELSRGITNKQIEGLEKWLDLLVVQGATSVEIGLKKYSLKDNTVDELIKKIKRYNVTGVLVEQSVGQEQYFKNSKIRDKNGNLLVVYHGSPSKGFKEFGMKLGGKFNPGSDKLMYFTDDYASAEVFSHETVPSSKSFTQVKRTGVSGEVRGFYLNITNPLDLTQLSKAEKELIAKNYADSQNGIKELDKADRKYIDFVNKTIQQIEDADKTNFSQYIKIFIEPCGIRNFLEKYGYDGMIAKMYYGKGSSYDGVRNDALEFAVLNSNQIKLIDNDTPTSSSKIDETLLIESDYNNKINKDSDEDIDGSINEAVKTNSFTPYTAGYILEDGSLLVMDEYHGETEIREFYPEYSNTHPEEDTCVRLYSRPNEAQYKRLEEIIDYYLNHEFYCKVEVWDKPLGKYSFYEVYSLYEGACRDTTWNEKIGNWTGYKLVQIIKNYFAKRVVESDYNNKINKDSDEDIDENDYIVESMSNKEKEVIDTLDKYFGQKEPYVWSTYILPNGHFLNPENYKKDDAEWQNSLSYEHEDFYFVLDELGSVVDGVFENYCIKVNVTFPYVAMPNNRATPEQFSALRKLIDRRGEFEYSFGEISDIVENGSDVYDMNAPLIIILKNSEIVVDLDSTDVNSIVKMISRAYTTGALLTESASNESEQSDKRDEIEDRVMKDLGTSSEPIDGPSYIMRDGSFLKIWEANVDINGMSGGKSVSGKAQHLDVDGYISKHEKQFRVNYYLNHNCIRVNTGFEEYMVMPKVRPNSKQFDSLLKWLDYYFINHSKIQVLDWYGSHVNSKIYYAEENLPEDIIKKIKRYYATGTLVETFKDDTEFFDEFSDFETYTELSEDSGAFKVVDNIVEELDIHKINLSLDYVVEARNKETDKTHYIATFNGGLNGEGEWSDYLEELEILFDQLDCWLISLESDVLDDRFTLKVGFNTIVGDDSGDLEEEFELTEVLPTNNETKEEFIARFMKETEEEYPNPKQRYAVALKYWEKRLAETFEGTEVKKGVRNKMKTKGFLEERFERNETLNPKLWDGDELKEEVRDKIYQIVDAFVAGLTDDNIEISVEDIVLIGSNASYNYSEQSDLDVHVIVDTSNLNCPDGLYPLLYSAYRSIFNKKYEIEFYGIDVELYIDEENTQTVSNGVYSLTQGWIKPPVREDIPEIDEEAFEEMFSEWEDEYFNIVQGEVIPDEKPIQPVTESLESNKIEEIENFIEDIYDLRKVSLSKQGEYSLGNLVFKEFRNLGYLDNLKALKSKLKSQELSITETYKLRESKDMNDYYTLESIKALAEEVQTDNRDGTYSIGEDGKLVKEDLTKGMQTSFFRPEITNSEIKEVLNVIGDSFGKAYLGLWYGDGEISYTLDLETAEKVAKIFNQQAVWDNGGGKSIDNADYDKTRKVDYKAATEELRKLLKK